MLDPLAVGLKFGFIAVLYLFILWVARSSLKDLHGPKTAGAGAEHYDDATGIHTAVGHGQPSSEGASLRLNSTGMRYSLTNTLTIGRSESASIRIDDPFASNNHAQVVRQGDAIVLEDLGSTNGTYLNDELVHGPQPLHDGDRIRIGDCELICER